MTDDRSLDSETPAQAREREALLHAVVEYMTRAYCAGMDLDECVLTVHAHENGTIHDRLLTLHVATGPVSAARLALQSVVSDVASVVFAGGGNGS